MLSVVDGFDRVNSVAKSLPCWCLTPSLSRSMKRVPHTDLQSGSLEMGRLFKRMLDEARSASDMPTVIVVGDIHFLFIHLNAQHDRMMVSLIYYVDLRDKI